MNTIKNVKPLSAEKLFDLLKTEFADYINDKLGSNLAIDYAHVADIINILFPEITEGMVFTLTVSDEAIEVERVEITEDYNTELLEQHLIAFLTLQAE
jgi:hypothetical protein